jgi:hypothetical protein
VPGEHFDRHDSLELLRSPTPITESFQMLLALRLTGISIDPAADPGTVFDVASRYVVDVIEPAGGLCQLNSAAIKRGGVSQ